MLEELYLAQALNRFRSGGIRATQVPPALFRYDIISVFALNNHTTLAPMYLREIWSENPHALFRSGANIYFAE